MHKAQGLTLHRVTYDAGPHEPDFAVGITFVALTRVRHPGHIVLLPFACSAERLTSGIGFKPSLHHRKLHEWELRRFAQKTARTWQHLHPPQSAMAPLPPRPEKPSQERNQRTPRTEAGKAKGVSINSFWSPPVNTQQQEQQLRQRRDEASSSTMPIATADVDVDMEETDELTADAEMPPTDVYDDVLMDEEDEPQGEQWAEEYEIDADEEERMADEMIAEADA